MNFPLSLFIKRPFDGCPEKAMEAKGRFEGSQQFPRTIHMLRRFSEVAERGLPGSKARLDARSLSDEFFNRNEFQKDT